MSGLEVGQLGETPFRLLLLLLLIRLLSHVAEVWKRLRPWLLSFFYENQLRAVRNRERHLESHGE